MSIAHSVVVNFIVHGNVKLLGIKEIYFQCTISASIYRCNTLITVKTGHPFLSDEVFMKEYYIQDVAMEAGRWSMEIYCSLSGEKVRIPGSGCLLSENMKLWQSNLLTHLGLPKPNWCAHKPKDGTYSH